MPFKEPGKNFEALLDAALTLQLSRVWKRQAECVSLESQFPLLSASLLSKAMEHATLLLASAFSAGRQALEPPVPDLPSIIARLKARHPGFSDAGYCDVINFGCFLAR